MNVATLGQRRHQYVELVHSEVFSNVETISSTLHWINLPLLLCQYLLDECGNFLQLVSSRQSNIAWKTLFDLKGPTSS